MEKHMPIAVVAEEHELVPGGDLRLKGNSWLRVAWESCSDKVPRVPRESEFRKIVAKLVETHPKICAFARISAIQCSKPCIIVYTTWGGHAMA